MVRAEGGLHSADPLWLGIKNIYLGPTIPAFVSDNVLSKLVELYNITPTSEPADDLKKILGS